MVDISFRGRDHEQVLSIAVRVGADIKRPIALYPYKKSRNRTGILDFGVNGPC